MIKDINLVYSYKSVYARPSVSFDITKLFEE